MNKPFSRRFGYQDVPPQLRLGEVSDQFRNRVKYAFGKILDDISFNDALSSAGFGEARISQVGKDLIANYWAETLGNDPNDAPVRFGTVKGFIDKLILKGKFWAVFDLCEYFANHARNREEFKNLVENACEQERLSYRFREGLFYAFGNAEQAKSLEKSINDMNENGLHNSSGHLLNSSRLLAEGDYSGSVRESAHALESVVRQLANGPKTFGPALSEISKVHSIHPAIKGIINKVYGYSSDEEGARHPLVGKAESDASESDALFTMTVAGSSISYLLSIHG